VTPPRSTSRSPQTMAIARARSAPSCSDSEGKSSLPQRAQTGADEGVVRERVAATVTKHPRSWSTSRLLRRMKGSGVLRRSSGYCSSLAMRR
jgi:hypothetical protein